MTARTTHTLFLPSMMKENESTKELLETYKTFTKMVKKPVITNDMDARYAAYAYEEAYAGSCSVCLATTKSVGLYYKANDSLR